MAEPKTIQQLMIEIMKDVGAVRKAERNDFHKFNFRGIDAVINALSPALKKHGVIVLPNIISIDKTDVATGKGSMMNRVSVIVEYTFIGPAGDHLTSKVAGEAFDSGDKATAKAMSVAMRTAMLQSFALPTDEPDPDLETYEATPGQVQNLQAQYQGQQPQGQQPQGQQPQGQPQQQQPQGQGQGQLNPQEDVLSVWDHAERLQTKATWYRKMGASDEFIRWIRNRIAELTGQPPQ